MDIFPNFHKNRAVFVTIFRGFLCSVWCPPNLPRFCFMNSVDKHVLRKVELLPKDGDSVEVGDDVFPDNKRLLKFLFTFTSQDLGLNLADLGLNLADLGLNLADLGLNLAEV